MLAHFFYSCETGLFLWRNIAGSAHTLNGRNKEWTQHTVGEIFWNVAIQKKEKWMGTLGRWEVDGYSSRLCPVVAFWFWCYSVNWQCLILSHPDHKYLYLNMMLSNPISLIHNFCTIRHQDFRGYQVVSADSKVECVLLVTLQQSRLYE